MYLPWQNSAFQYTSHSALAIHLDWQAVFLLQRVLDDLELPRSTSLILKWDLQYSPSGNRQCPAGLLPQAAEKAHEHTVKASVWTTLLSSPSARLFPLVKGRSDWQISCLSFSPFLFFPVFIFSVNWCVTKHVHYISH